MMMTMIKRTARAGGGDKSARKQPKEKSAELSAPVPREPVKQHVAAMGTLKQALRMAKLTKTQTTTLALEIAELPEKEAAAHCDEFIAKIKQSRAEKCASESGMLTLKAAVVERRVRWLKHEQAEKEKTEKAKKAAHLESVATEKKKLGSGQKKRVHWPNETRATEQPQVDTQLTRQLRGAWLLRQHADVVREVLAVRHAEADKAAATTRAAAKKAERAAKKAQKKAAKQEVERCQAERVAQEAVEREHLRAQRRQQHEANAKANAARREAAAAAAAEAAAKATEEAELRRRQKLDVLHSVLAEAKAARLRGGGSSEAETDGSGSEDGSANVDVEPVGEGVGEGASGGDGGGTPTTAGKPKRRVTLRDAVRESVERSPGMGKSRELARLLEYGDVGPKRQPAGDGPRKRRTVSDALAADAVVVAVPAPSAKKKIEREDGERN